MKILSSYFAVNFVDKCFIVASLIAFAPIVLLMSSGNSILASLLVLPFLIRALYLEGAESRRFLTRPRVYLCIAALFANAALHQFLIKPMLSGIIAA